MKVLFINPSIPRELPPTIRAENRYNPPLGALYLASFLAAKGIASEIIDTAIDDINFEKIKEREYGLVSFTVFIGEFQYQTRIIAKKIRKINPSCPIVCGGIMPSIFPEEFLKEYPIDYVIRYEGEHSLYDLIMFLEGKKNIFEINGLSYKKNNFVVHNPPRYLEANLDNFPVPKWELLGTNCNIHQIPYLFTIITSKGCPFKCSFCYNRQVEASIHADSPKWRFRSANHVIDEVKKINDMTGTRVFSFEDDNFLVNTDRAIKILNYFKSKGFFIEQCAGHMNNYKNNDLIEAMRGVVQTAKYSIESASPRLLSLIRKNIRIDYVPQINKKLFNNGISTIHYFIVGLPTETENDLKMNVDLMKKLKVINPFVRGHAYFYFPLPNTPLETYIIDEMGFKLPRSLVGYEKTHFENFAEGQHYRPWIDEEQYFLLEKYCDIFQEVFKINNQSISDRVQNIFDESPQLKKIFGDLDDINKPHVQYYPYVLDRLIRGEIIDLENDLIKMAKK